MRNSDAHLKNFALIYDDVSTATLAPGYEILSMSVYAAVRSNSRDADDDMAIGFQGTKRWLTAEMIKSLASRCLVTDKRLVHWKARIASALIETSGKVVDYVNDHPEDRFAQTARRMLELWAIGLDTFDRASAARVREMVSNHAWQN